MFDHTLHTSSTFTRNAFRGATAVIASAGLSLGIGGLAHADALPVPEGVASSYAVLAGSTITNTNISTVNGDIGLHSGLTMTGYADGADSIIHTGALHLGDGDALNAKNAATAAYTSAAAQGKDQTLPTPELNGLTLTRGVYASDSGTFANSGTVTFDAEGDPNAIFIFKMTKTLVTSSASSMVLVNGASSCNIYWVVGSSATLGSNSSTVGTIMADQSVGMDSGATLRGRAWASIGAVTLDNNTINNSCLVSTVPQGVDVAPVGGVQTGDGSAAAAATGTDTTLAVAGTVGVLVAAAVVYAVLTRRRLGTV